MIVFIAISCECAKGNDAPHCRVHASAATPLNQQQATARHSWLKPRHLQRISHLISSAENAIQRKQTAAPAVAIAAATPPLVYGIKQQTCRCGSVRNRNGRGAGPGTLPSTGTPLAVYWSDLRKRFQITSVSARLAQGSRKGRTELSQSGLITDPHKESA